MSDTPRTDAKIKELGLAEWRLSGHLRLLVEFARELERDLNQEIKRRIMLSETITSTIKILKG